MIQRTLAMLGAGLALSLGLSAPAQAQNPTEKSFQQARAALDAALKAAGGTDALRAVKDLARTGKGTAFSQGQSLKPEAPLLQRSLTTTAVADLAGRRSSVETELAAAPGGLAGRARSVLAGEAGFTWNRVTGAVTPLAPAALGNLRAALRRDPAVLLLTADSRSETLRWVGEAALDGRAHRVVSFADSDGAQLSLYIDAQNGRLSKYETLADNAVLGDTLTEVVLSDYRAVGGVQVPFRQVTRVAGEVTQDLAYSDIKINGGAADSLFAEPAAEIARVPVAAPQSTVTVTELGGDAYFVSGSSHNSLFVNFADYVLLVEAPISAERTGAVLAKIKETVGEKPVRYVVPTHYHFDHSGGLRAAVAAGATVVTTPSNQGFVEKLAAAPHSVRPDGLSANPRKPTVETFTGKREFKDAGHSVELYDVGPNPHADEVVVAYLPQQKVLFVSDLLSIPADGPLPPGSEITRSFANKLKELGLAVDKFAPGHGRLGTPKDLADILAKAAPAAGE
jgi:glyoxylase-like metal-dependent hydrolase (beta-lactamase superfamily II)